MSMLDLPTESGARTMPHATVALARGAAWRDGFRAALSGLRHQQSLWLVLRVALSGAVFVLIFRKLDVGTFTHVLRQMNPGWAAAGLLVGVLTVVLSAWQWQVLLKKEAIELPFVITFALYYIGITFNQLLPSSIGGDVAKGAYVARLSQRNAGAASATLMARIIGVAALLLTSLPVALVAALGGFAPAWGLALILILVTCAYVALVTALLMGPLLLQRLLPQRLQQTKLGRKALDFAAVVATYRQRPLLFVQATLISALFYAASNLNFYCFGLALHISAPFWFYWVATALAALATMLPISLNGYGVRGATFVALFALMGVSAAAALSMTVEMEVQMLIFAFIGAAMLPAINQRIARVNQSRAPSIASLEEMTLMTKPIENDAALDANATVASAAPLPRLQPRKPIQWAVAVSVVVFLAITFALVGQRAFAATPRVSLYTVKMQSITAYVGGGGLTYPAQSLEIAYPVSAQVLKVNVQVGQTVAPGQPLLTLDSAGLTAQLQEVYTEWQIAQNYADSLAAQGAPAPQQAAAQQQAAVAKSRYETLNQQISSPAFNKGVVSSTFAGIVTSINVVPGSYFKAGAQLLTLQDTHNIIVRAQFPLDDAGTVQVGQTVEVDPDAQAGQSFTGKVTSIVPALSQAGASTFEVWVTVPNPNGLLFTNESVYTRVSGQQTQLVVPEMAVLDASMNPYVFVYANGKAHVRPVVIGVRGNGQFGIVSGLAAGDQVILTGQYQLTDNQTVNAVTMQS